MLENFSKIIGSDLRLFFHNQGFLKNLKEVNGFKKKYKFHFLLVYPNIRSSTKYIFSSAINYNIQICLFKNNQNHICLNCLFPNEEDAELARCDTVGISSICAGMAGLITAQKTINTVLNTKNENNILTLVNTLDLSVTNINIKNNSNCLLNNS